jgi:hypothetical protein
LVAAGASAFASKGERAVVVAEVVVSMARLIGLVAQQATGSALDLPSSNTLHVANNLVASRCEIKATPANNLNAALASGLLRCIIMMASILIAPAALQMCLGVGVILRRWT